MRSIIAAIAIAASGLNAVAEEGAVPVTSSPPLSGSVDTEMTTPAASPLNQPLIRAGRRGTIQYFNRSPFQMPLAGGAGLDLNDDGAGDFRFGGGAAGTASIPGSFWMWFDIEGTGSNQFLVYSNFALVQPNGAPISTNNFAGFPVPFSGSWSAAGDVRNLTIFNSAPEENWAGPLGQLGLGYLGVRFQAQDGWHYGWIRVRLPTTAPVGISSGLPVVMDWAYEKRPDTPIRAGAVSSARGIKQFAIRFRNPDGTPHADHGHFSFGSAFLVGNILRYEMHVAGSFTNAALLVNPLIMPAARPVAARLDSPRIDIHLPCHWQQDPQSGLWTLSGCEGELTVFFGDIKLTALNLALLNMGRLRVALDGGAVIGDIAALAPDQPVTIIEVRRERPHGPVGGGVIPPLPTPPHPSPLTPEEQLILIEAQRMQNHDPVTVPVLPPTAPATPLAAELPQ